MRKKKNKYNIFLVTRSKLNSIENKISEELKDNEISPEDLTAFIDIDKNYPELKERIGIMKCQRSDIERNVRSDIKRMGTDEIIKQKEKINVNLKSQV